MTDKNRQLSENAGFGTKNPTSERSMDVEREPMPDRAPDTASDQPSIPPARSGAARKRMRSRPKVIQSKTPRITPVTFRRR